MCEPSLLNGQKILSIFDTGSSVNLISDEIVKNHEYLSSLPVHKCCQFTIRNTSTSVMAESFIEVFFKINDNLVLHTTSLIVPDFGNVKFLMSTGSMSELQTVFYVASKKIIMKKKSFIFQLTYYLKLKPNESKIIQIKCALPRALHNGDYIAKTFRPFLNYFPNTFMCTFSKGVSYISVTNPT